MKNISLIAAALAPLFFAVPAHAQSANDWMRHDEARDPGYQSAVRGGGYNNYDNRSDANAQPNVSCTSVLILFTTCKQKQQVTMCMTPYGPAELSSKGVRLAATGQPVPRNVRMKCGGNDYEASQ
jgi:hypothetical protein